MPTSVRGTPSYNEQGILTLPFEYDSTIVYDPSYYDGSFHAALLNNNVNGVLVALTVGSTVGLGTSGAYPMGKLVKVEPNSCTVEVGGTMAVPYVSANANPPLIGRGIQTDGAGNAISPAGGVRLATERGIVLALDTTNQICYVYMGGAS